MQADYGTATVDRATLAFMGIEPPSTPYAALWRAVLVRAVLDAMGQAIGVSALRRQEERQAARDWITSDDCRAVCELADIDPAAFRAAALDCITNGRALNGPGRGARHDKRAPKAPMPKRVRVRPKIAAPTYGRDLYGDEVDYLLPDGQDHDPFPVMAWPLNS